MPEKKTTHSGKKWNLLARIFPQHSGMSLLCHINFFMKYSEVLLLSPEAVWEPWRQKHSLVLLTKLAWTTRHMDAWASIWRAHEGCLRSKAAGESRSYQGQSSVSEPPTNEHPHLHSSSVSLKNTFLHLLPDGNDREPQYMIPQGPGLQGLFCNPFLGDLLEKRDKGHTECLE